MIPEGFATLYAFLGLVTPGLVYQLLREQSRPALEETAFREASRVALTSVLLTSLSLLTLALASALQPRWFVDLEEWLRLGTPYLAEHWPLVASSVFGAVSLACLYAVGAHLLVESVDSRRKERIVRTDVWYQLFADDVEKEHVPWVLIKTDKGVKIWGHVEYFTIGRSMDDREVAVTGPNLTIQDGEHKKEETYWERIWIPASQMQYMKVAYEVTAAEAARRQGSPQPPSEAGTEAKAPPST